ncbi:glycosyltransferase [Bellilinea sp.]|jgi:glycosyltransferase involved in cell wall biosynthesis|uniref:Glucosyl-3-phosphoglycerate synthase n=1 Tax=Bellilinea caldifistulae TaxID=360411 RepID=A0A7C4L3G9_9CHLR
MAEARCSIVIRAYNEEKHIGRLLSGILQQTVREVQIILVDSGSTDATLAVASRFPVEVVHIRPQEFTFGRSLNLGIAQARADVVVMASAHVYPVYPDWLERLIEPFEDPQIAVAYGKQRGAETTQYSEHQVFRRWFPDQSTRRQAHPFCNNANAAIRRALWEQHAYDELLTGLEDLAWARWAQSQGYGVAYVAEAEVVHVHQETWRGIYNRYRREGMAFKQIYPQEHFRFTDFVRLWVSNVWSDWRAAAAEGLLGREWANIVRFRLMQFWGTYQGYRQSGPLTWQLKQTFYYPNLSEIPNGQTVRRDVQPIQYKEGGE